METMKKLSEINSFFTINHDIFRNFDKGVNVTDVNRVYPYLEGYL